MFDFCKKLSFFITAIDNSKRVFYNQREVIRVGDFISAPSLVKFYYPDDALKIINVGYDDFEFVSPSKTFRTQNFYTWHFVMSGRGTLRIYGKTYDVCAGDSFFIPPDEPMCYFPSPDEPWEYVWFASSGDLMEEYARTVGFSEGEPLCKCRNFKRIRSCLKKLFDAIASDEGGYFAALSAFYEVMDISTSRTELSEIRRVARLIDESFATPGFSVERICKDVGISHSHLLRLFKKAYGVTIIKYVTDKRLSLARELLCTTELSVRSVAYSCGFSDEIHFMKAFKKATGLSCLRYRKLNSRI